jgi:hypothetical protein
VIERATLPPSSRSRPGRRGRDHGRPPPALRARGRAVPSRVDPDARGQAAAAELPRQPAAR